MTFKHYIEMIRADFGSPEVVLTELQTDRVFRLERVFTSVYHFDGVEGPYHVLLLVTQAGLVPGSKFTYSPFVLTSRSFFGGFLGWNCEIGGWTVLNSPGSCPFRVCLGQWMTFVMSRVH